MKKQNILFLPDFYYADKNNYLELWLAVREESVTSRTLVDYFSIHLNKAARHHDISNFAVSHWHCIVNENDGWRSVRNYLKADKTGMRPVYHSKRFDFMRHMCIPLQAFNPSYRFYAQNWYQEHIYSNDDSNVDAGI